MAHQSLSLVDLLLFGVEETANFLDSGVFDEVICIFKSRSMFWVVSHEVLGEINAWVKSHFNTVIDFSIFSCNKSIDFS